MKRTLRISDVAAELGCTERTVRNWCKAGEIQAVRIGRRWYVLADELDDRLSAEIPA